MQQRYRVTKYEKNKLEILNDRSHSPTAVIICGNDGGIEHAISTVGTWIFDSNLKMALPLTKSSLNWCAGKSGFNGVHIALRLYSKK